MHMNLLSIMKIRSKVEMEISFQLSGEFEEKLDNYLQRGLFKNKPETVRDALRHLFDQIDESDFQRVRMNLINPKYPEN